MIELFFIVLEESKVLTVDTMSLQLRLQHKYAYNIYSMHIIDSTGPCNARID